MTFMLFCPPIVPSLKYKLQSRTSSMPATGSEIPSMYPIHRMTPKSGGSFTSTIDPTSNHILASAFSGMSGEGGLWNPFEVCSWSTEGERACGLIGGTGGGLSADLTIVAGGGFKGTFEAFDGAGGCRADLAMASMEGSINSLGLWLELVGIVVCGRCLLCVGEGGWRGFLEEGSGGISGVVRSDLVSKKCGRKENTLLVLNFNASVRTSFTNGSMHWISPLCIILFELSITCNHFGEGKKVAVFRRRNGAQLVALIVTIPVSYWVVLKRHTQSNTYNTNSYSWYELIMPFSPQRCQILKSDWSGGVEFSMTTALIVVLAVIQMTSLY